MNLFMNRKQVCMSSKKIKFACLWEAELLMESLTCRVGQCENANHSMHSQLWKLLQNVDLKWTVVKWYTKLHKSVGIKIDKVTSRRALYRAVPTPCLWERWLKRTTNLFFYSFYSILINSNISWYSNYWNEIGRSPKAFWLNFYTALDPSQGQS